MPFYKHYFYNTRGRQLRALFELLYSNLNVKFGIVQDRILVNHKICRVFEEDRKIVAIYQTHTHTHKHTQIHEYVPDLEKKKRIAYNYTIRITAMRGS